MSSFVDSDGVRWELDINLGAAVRIKDAIGYRLTDLIPIAGGDEADRELIEERMVTLFLDEETLCKAIYAACKYDMDSAGVSLDAFFERMDGKTIPLARNAFIDEVAVFFDGIPGRGDVIRGMKKQFAKMMTGLSQSVATAMESQESEQEANPSDDSKSLNGKSKKEEHATGGQSGASQAKQA